MMNAKSQECLAFVLTNTFIKNYNKMNCEITNNHHLLLSIFVKLIHKNTCNTVIFLTRLWTAVHEANL